MLKFISLSSGSKGNASCVITEEVKILIDIGVNYSYLTKELEKIGFTPYQFDYVLITHIHSDHTKGLKQLINKTNIKALIPSGMINEIKTIIDSDNVEIIGDINLFKDIKIELIYTSHDTECSVGYIITNNNSSMVYITDTGYINRKYYKKLENHDLYFIESNHDEEMLMNGPYPYYLKQRVISDRGHLSNKTTAKYLKNSVGDKTKYIVLAHISENNNTNELALLETKNKLEEINFDGEILLAKQNESTKIIEV